MPTWLHCHHREKQSTGRRSCPWKSRLITHHPIAKKQDHSSSFFIRYIKMAFFNVGRSSYCWVRVISWWDTWEGWEVGRVISPKYWFQSKTDYSDLSLSSLLRSSQHNSKFKLWIVHQIPCGHKYLKIVWNFYYIVVQFVLCNQLLTVTVFVQMKNKNK